MPYRIGKLGCHNKLLLLLLSRFSCVDSAGSHRRQPTRLPCFWDSPGKNTGVGCHFLLQEGKIKGQKVKREGKLQHLEVLKECSIFQIGQIIIVHWLGGSSAVCSPSRSQNYRVVCLSSVTLKEEERALESLKPATTWK